MSLFQPSFMSPRNSTIDTNVKDEIVFSCQLNGNSVLYGYDIFVYNPDTNALEFQLTSSASKTIIQNQLKEEQANLQAIQDDLSAKNTLMRNCAADQQDTTYSRSFTDFYNNNIGKIDTLLGLLENEGSESEFWSIGDSIISAIESLRPSITAFQERIESTYKTIISKYHKRLSNNSIQLDINIKKYKQYKENQQMRKTVVTTLEKLINFMGENKDSADSSAKGIGLAYWDLIIPTTQEQVDELEEQEKDKQKEVDQLTLALNSLSKGMFVLKEPLYPVDYLGNAVVLYHQFPKGVFQNGKNYKWKIRLFWSSTNNPDNLDQSIDSQECYFECRTTPTIEIDNCPTLLDKRFFEFHGNYQQAENIPINYFRWVLTNAITGEVLRDTGIIPSPDVRFYYDSFLNEYQYTIQLFVTNQNGITVQTEPQLIKVKYVQAVIDNLLEARSSTEEHGIIVNWSAIHSIVPNIYGDYHFAKDLPTIGHTSLVLHEGCQLVFDKDNGEDLKIPASISTHIISIRFDNPPHKQDETVYEATGTNGGMPYYRRLTLQGTTLTYDINGIKIFHREIFPDTLHWYVVIMLPDKFYVIRKWASGLFPKYGYIHSEEEIGQIREEDLVPHTGLFPEQLTYHNSEQEEVLI